MFRIWANRILKEYIIKVYVMDDEHLKEPQNFFGKDYRRKKDNRSRKQDDTTRKAVTSKEKKADEEKSPAFTLLNDKLLSYKR